MKLKNEKPTAIYSIEIHCRDETITKLKVYLLKSSIAFEFKSPYN